VRDGCERLSRNVDAAARNEQQKPAASTACNLPTPGRDVELNSVKQLTYGANRDRTGDVIAKSARRVSTGSS
jgi:hypothetical protein